jgi:shikimate kinase
LAPLLFLTGYMGSGKSTVGQLVARRLGWQFVDLDDAVVAEAGKDIPSIFEGEGEAGFRRREFVALGQIVMGETLGDGVVVALGGGTLTNSASAALVEGRAAVVYLDIDTDEAWKRVCRSDRPLAQERQEFELRLALRRPLYESAADLVIPVGRQGPEKVAARIVEFIKQGGASGL